MRILSCDDHALFREGLRAALRRLPEVEELLEAGSAHEAFGLLAERDDVDLVLLDLALPDVSGLDTLRALRSRHLDVGVVVVSASERPSDAREALRSGALGFIPKSSSTDELLAALGKVLGGEVFVPAFARDGAPADPAEVLTARQREVLRLLGKGLTNPEIARTLGIGAETVKVHVRQVLRALDASNRTEAVGLAQRAGLLDD